MTVGVPDQKYGVVWAQLIQARADQNQAGTLYLSFASATCWTEFYLPYDIALGCEHDSYEEGVNKKLATFFTTRLGPLDMASFSWTTLRNPKS